MYFPDLTTECQVDRGGHVRAIGWLAAEHPFPTGPVPAGFLTALRSHVLAAWQPIASMGGHLCEFCVSSRADEGCVGGSTNVWIPTASRVYVAPELIVHYIEAH